VAKIFVTDNKYDSNVIKVFLADNKYDADLWFCKMNDKYDAGNKDELWYFTDDKYDASASIYWVDNKYDADVIVYRVDNKYDAKWNNSNKWQSRIG